MAGEFCRYALAELNPYESPSAVSSPLESPTVVPRISVVRFALAGLTSGTISLISFGIPPLGLFVPPLVFGIALSLARGCRSGASAALIGVCCGAWFASLVAAALTMSLEHLPPMRGFWPGLICGAVGSLIILAVYYALYPSPTFIRNLLVIGSIGAVVGGVCTSTSIYLADHGILRDPNPHGLIFPVWQTSVALSLAISERFSGPLA